MHWERTRLGLVVGVNGSPESDAAIRWATQEAMLHGEQLTLVHVVAPLVMTWPVLPVATGIEEWQLDNAELVLETARKTVHAAAGRGEPPEVRTEVRHAGIAEVLVDWSREASMTVVGSRRLGLTRRVLEGSVSGQVVRHAKGPVAVVHAHEAHAPGPASPVVLGVDGSPASEDATTLAFDEASRRGVGLVALHAWADLNVQTMLGIDWKQYEGEGREVLAERLAGWQERYPDVTVVRRIVVDDPAQRLIDASQEAQLVVVGSHGRGGFSSMLLGSVAARVAAGAAAPTIVCRPR